MTRAAIYVRVSTARQAERDLSIPDQIVQCRTWCARQGIEVVQIFSEPGASALDEDRPVFQEMIHTAKRTDKPFDLVVVCCATIRVRIADNQDENGGGVKRPGFSGGCFV